MSLPRIVLHIGSTKTGSSALQSTLFERRDALAKAGVLYSMSGVAASAHHVLAASIHPGAWRMHVNDLPEDRSAYFDEQCAAIKAEAAAMDAHTIVLSTEYFWGSFEPSIYHRVRDAFEGYPIEVVAFVREPDEWVMSSYLQAVKSGESRDFDDWFSVAINRWHSGIHCFRVIHRWDLLLKAQKTHVVRYADARKNVFKAFCEVVGIDVDTSLLPKVVNPSPSPEGYRLLLELNQSDLPDGDKASERRRIMAAHRATSPSEPMMSEEKRAEILRMTLQSDRLLSKTYLHGEPVWHPKAPADGDQPETPLATAAAPGNGR